MSISKIYFIESQIWVLSSGMTGKRQIMVDSIWIDKESAQKFVKFMKKLQGSGTGATIYKIKELKLDTVSDFIFRPHTGTLSVRFTRDSVNCYGDFLKDHYYSLDVANGHSEPMQPFNRVNKTYLSLTGDEIWDIQFVNWNKKEFKAGSTIKETFV